jgi:dihydropyrimidinase
MTIPTWHARHSTSLDDLLAVVEAGVSSFKLYLAYDGLRLEDVELYRAMNAIADVAGLPIVHCENGPLCEALRTQALAQGETSPIYHALTRPPRQEAEAVSRAIDIATLAGTPVYIVHISCEEVMERVRVAQANGDEVYGETCPQYLFLSEISLDLPGGELLICSPPLRTEEDNDALWGGLAFGDLDVLATDHCPFPAADKRGHADFTTIPGGLPSIEARLSLAYHSARQHGMTLERWADICCTNPARIFGLGHKGLITPGYDADLVIFDPAHSVTLQAGKTLHERVDWSPYEGMLIQGWPRHVLSRGRMVVRDFEFVGEPGWGRFVPRE